MTLHRLRRVTPSALAAAAVFALGACQDSLKPPPTRPIGYLAITVDGDAAPDETTPTATFFRAQGIDLIDSRFPNEQCQVTGFVATPGQTNSFPAVNAGEAVELELASGKVQLVPEDVDAGRLYTLPTGQSVVINPGETATLRVPGDATAFPATTFTLETVTAFAFDSLPNPTATGDAAATWTSNGGTGAAMVISLRYQPSGANAVNSQVICVVADDGAFSIPVEVLGGWRSSSTINRSALATRLRTAVTVLPTNDAEIYGLSTFTKSVPVPTQ